MNPGTRTTFRRVQTDLSEFIPEGWSAAPLKRYFRVVGGSTPKSDPENWDGDIPWVTPADLSGRESLSIRRGKRSITERGLGSCGAELVPKGSIVISTRAPIGSLAIADTDLSTNQGCKALVPTRAVDSRFFAYGLSISTPQLNALGQGSTFSELSGTNLGRFCLPVPPLQEQRRIAAFLDYETARIDELVHEQQQLHRYLVEKRQAKILRLITRGIDESVSLKNTGVEWLGVIPDHWRVVRIKHLSPVHRGASPRPIDDQKYFDDDGRYSWVRIADVSKAGKYLTKTDQRLSMLGSTLSVKLEPGSLFLSIAGTVGKPCITRIPACIHDGFVYFPRLRVDPEFLYYVFEAGQAYQGLGKKGTQLNLNTETVGNISVGMPPQAEIRRIIQAIRQETQRIDSLIEINEHSLGLLQERRGALITAAVTGQLDLRKWQPPEHAQAAEVA